MKIKAADIARNLNLSKATVSLVLNDKSGVSEKTRQRIFDYIKEVTYGETTDENDNQESRKIKKPMVVYDNDLGNEYHCVAFGGMEGIRDCVDYLTGDIQLTALKMEHFERAYVAMLFLEQEIKGAISCKFKSFSNCKIVPGQTVK